MQESWASRPCLVTGGSGFGGAHLCEALVARQAKVYVLDRWLPRSSYLALSGLAHYIEFIAGDVRDLGLVQGLLERLEIDTVFHLAAQPIVMTSNTMPLETLSVNAMGTYAVLEALRLASGRRRLIFASSGAYYGATSADRALTEDEAPLPAANVYAPSKVAADFAVRSYARTYGIQAAVCRFVNTYGPGDMNRSRIVPHAIESLLSGRPYEFRDDGKTRLDYLHVDDMARAYIHVAENLESVSGEAFNFGSGRPITTAELSRLISIAFDGKQRTGTFTGVTNDVPAIKYLDITQARTRLGWQPSITIEDGLASTVDWYRHYFSI